MSNCTDYSSNAPYQYDTTQTGEKLDIIWAVKHDTLSAPPHILSYIYGDNILFAYNQYLHCLNKINGETIWKVISNHTNNNIYKGGAFADEFYPVGANDFIYIANRYIERRSFIDGSLIWHYEPPNGGGWARMTNHTSHSDNFLYLSVSDRNEVVCINKQNGAVIWTAPIFPTDGSVDLQSSWTGPPTYYNGRVYVGTREWPGKYGLIRNGSLICYDAATGNRIWKSIIPPPDNTIQNYTNWTLLNDNEIETTIIPTNDGFIFPTGYVLAKVDTSGKLIWRKAISIDGNLSTYNAVNPIFEGNVAYFTNNGGSNSFIFAFDLNKDIPIWISLMNPFGDSQTQGVALPIKIDKTSVYKLTDAQWFLGFNKLTGSLDWKTCLDLVFPKGRSYEYCFTPVEIENGNTIYFVGEDHIVCARRHKK